MPWRVMIEDDRGGRVPLLTVRWWRPGVYGGAYRAAQEAMRDTPFSWGAVLVRSPSYVVGALGGLIPALMYNTARLWCGRALAYALMVLLMGVWFGVAGTWAWRRAIAADLRRELLARGWCASCGYQLWDIAPEADGCRVCPECGGAWRVVR